MIAHRLSSVVDADRIFVLKDGEIKEEGTHQTLCQENGLYAHMWEEYNKSVELEGRCVNREFIEKKYNTNMRFLNRVQEK